MKQYPQERKDAVLERMMPPNNIPVSVLAQETGISDVTLYHWRKQAKAGGMVVPGDGKNPENWSTEDKFAVVLETAALNEAELAEDTDAMPHLLGSSVSYRVAVGPQQGQKAFMIRTIRPLDRPDPGLERVAKANGFSLHAGVSCEGHQRRKR